MVIDKSYIDTLNRTTKRISQELADILLDRLGQEPKPYSYTEQDLREQSRKIIDRYQTSKGRLELVYGIDKLEIQLEMLQSQIQHELSVQEADTKPF